jgi:hypothetical protein
MDAIFSFVALRPTSKNTPPAPTLAADTDFQRQLAVAAGGQHALNEASVLAQNFVQSGRFLGSPGNVELGEQLVSLYDQLSERGLPDEFVESVREFLLQYDHVVWASDAAKARDSVLAGYLVEGGEQKAATALKLARIYAIIEAVRRGNVSGERLNSLLRDPLVLPDYLLGLRRGEITAAPGPSPDDTASTLLEQFTTAVQRRERLAETLQAINNHDEDELLISELGEQRPLASLYQSEPPGKNQINPSMLASRPNEDMGLLEGRFGEHRDIPSDELADGRANGGVAKALHTMVKPFRLNDSLETSPLRRVAARSNVVFSDKALRLLSEPVRQMLKSLNIDPTNASLQEMHTRVLGEHDVATQTVRNISIQLSNLIMVSSKYVAGILGRYHLDPLDEPQQSDPVASAPPATFNKVKPLGVADLYLVRTHLLSYERGEVAAIENILDHEKLTHTFSRTDQTEIIDSTESEQIDLQTMAQTTATENNDKTIAQAIGAGRGPLTSDGPESFSKAVTDQVSSSASKRTRQASSLRQLRTRQETIEHVFDNTGGAEELYGVYQWLDRVYQAQVFNYGSRLLYDLIIPEPAALYLEALSRPRGQGSLPPRPAKFTLRPDQLNDFNWSYYAAGHQASGIEPPPQDKIIVAEVFGGKAPDPFSGQLNANTFEMAESRTILVPKGYQATSYRLLAIASGWSSYVLRAFVGSKVVDIGDAWNGKVFSGKLDNEVEKIPVGLIADGDGANQGISTLAVGIEIICQPTDTAIAAWQTKTHGLILAGNQRRLAEYAERVANRDAGARLQLQNLTNAQKLEVMRSELKRTTLAVLTNQNFSTFNANRIDSYGFPYPDVGSVNVLSAYIRFFEQAVEWQHLECAFLPYFWGGQSSWVSKLLSSETNQQFAAFLTSGAARVVLPIRPGYEQAFDRFLNTGKTPTTDELLDVGGPLWVSLVTQLRDQANPEANETPFGQPWQFRLASGLVRLRKDGLLPRWSLNNGQWVEQGDNNS